MLFTHIACLLKPSACQKKEDEEIPTEHPDTNEDYTQEELLEFGGIGAIIMILISIILWCLSKLVKNYTDKKNRERENTMCELKEIRQAMSSREETGCK